MKDGDRVIADETAPFTSFVYQLFSQGGSYTSFLEQYMNCDIKTDCTWAFYDYGKVGLDQHSSIGERSVSPSLVSLYTSNTSSTLTLLAHLTFSDSLYHQQGGAAAQLWTRYAITSHGMITISVEWFNKTATRLPEAFWLRFNSTSGDRFKVKKLGVEVDGAQVMNNGSAHLHGTQYGVRNEVMMIEHLNSPLVCLGEPTPFPTPLPPHQRGMQGISYNLVNNIWGTNYPLAYPFLPEDGNSAFHFFVRLTDVGGDEKIGELPIETAWRL